MAIIVQKFGGTSVANLERITRVAKIIAAEVEKGHRVAVVVSAMAGVTNQLISWVNQSSQNHPDPAEHDVVVSTGEQVTCGLLALTLQRIGVPARSWLAWQLQIKTDDVYQNAQVHAIDTNAISESLEQGHVAVIAGFQGVNAQQRLTTLGRGGSDTTAVALAYALQAERCDIYTDVEGVFTADPQVVPEARKLTEISYASMLALSYHGAKVLQPQSVELAMACRVPVEVRSSFSFQGGTRLVQDLLHEPSPVGVSCDDDVALFVMRRLEAAEEVFSQILNVFEEEKIPVTLSVLKASEAGEGHDFVFTVKRDLLEKTKLVLHELSDRYPSLRLEYIPQAANVALVGNQIESHRIFVRTHLMKQFEERGIVCYGLVRYPNKMVFIVDEKGAHESMRLIHQLFQLEKEDAQVLLKNELKISSL